MCSNLFGSYSRQDVAVDSWFNLQKKYPNEIEFRAIQFKDDVSQYEDKIKHAYVLSRSSLDFVENGTKKLPFLKDILMEGFYLAEKDESITHIGWINSDIITTTLLVEEMKHNQHTALAMSRLDIEEVINFGDVLKNGIKIIRNEISGFDACIVSKEWWYKNRHLINEYFISQPEFDPILAGIIAITGGTIYNNTKNPLICHAMHPNQWQGDSPEKQWNQNMRKNNPFDHLCFNMMHYHLQKNLCNRRPWGAFKEPQNGELEFTKDFFDIFSLVTENQIKYVG